MVKCWYWKGKMGCHVWLDWPSFIPLAEARGFLPVFPCKKVIVLAIPTFAQPPKIGEQIKVKGIDVIVDGVDTPEDFYKGKGAPIARQMEENDIGWRVDCILEK